MRKDLPINPATFDFEAFRKQQTTDPEAIEQERRWQETKREAAVQPASILRDASCKTIEDAEKADHMREAIKRMDTSKIFTPQANESHQAVKSEDVGRSSKVETSVKPVKNEDRRTGLSEHSITSFATAEEQERMVRSYSEALEAGNYQKALDAVVDLGMNGHPSTKEFLHELQYREAQNADPSIVSREEFDKREMRNESIKKIDLASYARRPPALRLAKVPVPLQQTAQKWNAVSKDLSTTIDALDSLDQETYIDRDEKLSMERSLRETAFTLHELQRKLEGSPSTSSDEYEKQFVQLSDAMRQMQKRIQQQMPGEDPESTREHEGERWGRGGRI